MKKYFLLLISLFVIEYSTYSQENISYQKPPKEILELADYQRAPSVSMDSKKINMMLTYRNTYKTLEDLNQDELRLGGVRINPNTNISSTVTYLNNIKLRKLNDKNEIQVQNLPSNPKIANLSWSPDDSKIAFTNTGKDGLELWIIDVASAKANKISDLKLNANLGEAYNWFADSKALLVKVIPSDRPALIDSKKDLPSGPTVSTSTGAKAPNRTFQDLLKNKIDEMNFENIVSCQLYKISLDGKSQLFKDKDMYSNTSFSPDGKYILATTIQKPFSYLVPYNRFPAKQVVYDLDGKEIKTVNEIALSEVLPKGFMAVRKGKRSMTWRNDKAATLVYVEALDEGNPENKVEYRDEVFTWDAPFSSNPVSLVKTIQRYEGIIWGNDNVAVLYDSWYDTRNTKTYLINPSDSKQKPIVITDRNSQDIYSDPGDFETNKNMYNRNVLSIEDNKAFLIGAGHTPKGQFPFVDEFDLKTQKTKRLYQSEYTDKIEDILAFTDFKKGEVLVQIQSKSEYPNYFKRNIRKKNELNQITDFKNPFESIKDVHKELIKYKRKDGVELSGVLYLPKGYDKNSKEKLPLLIWAYPAEYKDKNSAGQTNNNPNEFTFPYYGSFVYWVTRGYAVLDDAAFPIIGEGKEEPNDTFLPQLIDNAEAAINAVDSLGYIDRNKVAVGGHSYGAFMTANLLTHSKLFACGIARSGAYNRTLTPFGFQNEQRNYWEASTVYNTMSPFMNAEKMKTPLLLVHGDADNNPGTFSLQSERYFQALKGLGAPVRLLLLPKEAHSYVAKENIFHLLWEQDQFLEKNLKNK